MGDIMSKPFATAFYKSREWERVRQYCLMRDRYKCQRCGKPAKEVHHIIHLSPENIYDVKISLNPLNLASLCRDCHFAQHEEDKRSGKKHYDKSKHSDCADGLHFDENGMLVRD
jgi:5-methylcytosine-specific restriction endonuclease McrA